MGKKLQIDEPVAHSSSVDKVERKKRKNNKHRESGYDGQEELTSKRKFDEVQQEPKKEKKKKKKDHIAQKAAAEEESKELPFECKVGQDEKIVVTGKDSKDAKYAPIKSFADSKLPDNVLKCCKDFKNPSPIQAHAWPFLLDGRDFIGIAKTGSGKTLAYGIPAVMHVLSKRKGGSKKRNPLCLVLAPTRELADQISVVVCDAGESCGVKSVCLYGGTQKGPQVAALKSGVDIVIATPGRLKDLIEMDVCHLSDVSFVDFKLVPKVKLHMGLDAEPNPKYDTTKVLDEADRMLDMGFRQEVRSILSNTCSARQMIMFSATWPIDVHNLAEEYMDANPIKVVVGSEDTAANHDVMQIVEVLEEYSRDKRLLALLEKYHESQRNRVLVFALYQKEAERLEGMLRRSGWNVVAIHGNKAQNHRTEALSLFKKGKCPLMVATDVAARGLDVPDVEVVINYSFPLTTEDYVHRIGRTGRAGKKGVAHTFFTQQNKGLSGELVNILREAGQVVPAELLKFGTHVKKKESKLYGAHFKEISADAPKAKKIVFNSDDED